ncbi:MAG: thioredoxin domain-containing protein, partial [Dehalococcoidia bacterium]
FLTPDGEALSGSTYVPPEQMLELLPKVWVYFQSNKDEVAQKVAELRDRRLQAMSDQPATEVTGDVYDTVLKSVGDHYDPMYGGFGDAPKFPHSDAIDLLLYAHRKTRDPDVLHMARKTLEAMGRGGVYDQEWGGFFRYSTKRDWSEPHYEKMLEDHGGLLKALLSLYRITGDDEHAGFARRTIDYIERKLRDPDEGFFYGSQDADEEFYKLSKADREGKEEPYIDRTCYTSWNAMAASAYLDASWTLDRPDLRDAAVRALTFLWDDCREPGKGMYRFHDGSGPQVLGLLGDQSHTARAMLDAYEVTGDPVYLDRAEELAAFLRDRFLDPDGNRGFFDVWDEPSTVGRLDERQKSLQDNTVCAELFLRLHHLTRRDGYRDTARSTLETFVSAVPHMGHFAAGYARQADTFLNPPAEVNIVGDMEAAAGLHRAALALDVPSRSVQIVNPGDAKRLEALALPPEPAPAAYACFGTMCSPPVTEPDGLLASVKHMAEVARPA